MPESKKIELKRYLLSDSNYLSGNLGGKEARKDLELDKFDKNNGHMTIFISEEIIGIGFSFFLGLFSPSIKKLGEKKFRKRFIFDYENIQTEKLVKLDVEYGINRVLEARTFIDVLFGVICSG